MDQEKKDLIKEGIKDDKLKLLSNSITTLLLLIITSLFSWIWIPYFYWWKITLTVLIILIICISLYNWASNIIDKVTDQELEKLESNGKPISRFQQKLNDKLKEQEDADTRN